MRFPRPAWAACFALVITAPIQAQPLADPKFLEQYAETGGFNLGRPTSATITPDGKVLFLRSGPRTFVRDLYEFDPATGQERVLLTAEKILQGQSEQLTAEELARRERQRSTARGIASFQLSDDGKQLLVPLSGQLYVIDRASGDVKKLPDEGGSPVDARFSPNGKLVACVRSGDLYVIDVAAGTQLRLTSTASETLSNATAEFVAQEEMGRFAGYWWSPDSKRLVYQETEEKDVEVLRITDPAHPERAPNTFRYPRPGRTNASVRLGVVPVTGGEATWVDWDHAKYPYLATVKWAKRAPLTILVQNREQTAEELLSVDAENGKTSLLLRETDPAWVNLEQSCPWWLDEGKRFLWITERDGARQLELRQRDGELIRALTPVDFGLRGLVDVDEKGKKLYVSGSPTPTQSQVYELSLDDPQAKPKPLTNEPGLHSMEFSKDFQTRYHAHSAPGVRPTQRIERADGAVAGELKSAAERPPFEANIEFTQVAAPVEGVDKPLEFEALVIRPRDFQAGRKYPVIVSVYGGPGSQTVLQSYGHHLLQWMADHGFIVVSLDGRGTPERGRDWERVIKGDLITVPLRDQVAGLQALGKKYPEMDLSRVGIYGWSFGGYFSAMAAMQRPDVYHAAIAGAPVVDWLDYDTHYTERYLGVPNSEKLEDDPAYKRSNVLTYAEGLQRPLLFIHGTADDNVYFAHSVKAADALFRAGKPFDFLPLAGQTHMVAEPTMVRRRGEAVMDFFLRHLRDSTPTPVSGR